MQIKKSDWLISAATGATMGLILMGGAMLQDSGITPLSHEQQTCAEDDPCWDSKTMGNHMEGRDGMVCRWDGNMWVWSSLPMLPCPWAYSK